MSQINYDLEFIAMLIIIAVPVIMLILKSRRERDLTKSDEVQNGKGYSHEHPGPWQDNWGLRNTPVFVDATSGSLFEVDAIKRVTEAPRLKIQARLRLIKSAGGLIEDVYRQPFFTAGENEPRPLDPVRAAFFDSTTYWSFRDSAFATIDANKKFDQLVEEKKALIEQLRTEIEFNEENIDNSVEKRMSNFNNFIKSDSRPKNETAFEQKV